MHTDSSPSLASPRSPSRSASWKTSFVLPPSSLKIMPRDYAALPVNEVRRRDRAQHDDVWIRAFLHRAAMGTLATVHDGQPFINSNLFAYDEATQAIYMHTAQAGRTRANVEREQRVCFSVSEMGRMLPADKALEFSVEYAGVV